MSITSFVKLAIDNSHGILTGFAVAGTVTTAVLTGKAAYGLGGMLSDYTVFRDKIENDPTPREIVKAHWKEFAPAVIVGAATVTCIVAAS